MTPRRRQRRSGYVLVMTLVVLGLAAMVLARLASRGVALSLEARRRAVELQEKWTRLSCQRRLLEGAEHALGDLAAAAQREGLGWPFPSTVEARFTMGGSSFRVVLADEQAKAGLNAIYQERPDQAHGLLALAAHEAGTLVPLKLRPRVGATRGREPIFNSWGDVVDMAALAGKPRGAESLLRVASAVTPWGDGRLNAARASDAALTSVCQLELTPGETQKLLDARRGYDGDLGELLKTAELPARKLVKLRRRLTDRSTCYGLWLVKERGDAQRLTLAVRDPSRRDQPDVVTYPWP